MCYSERKNESMFMCSSKIKSLDGIKAAAKKLKNSLSSFDFELNHKFCDAGEPKAWENKSISDEFLTFFVELSNIKKRPV